ncbi:MAG: antibiotic biosynthesis monooxygenase [Hyphomicrobiales bacterium]|nr:antibiotic biosynthesis monooxygenase [Hyphomicrobiales bacterium]
MFIAMNRFKVLKGNEEAFETLWKSRETYLHELPGFQQFALLRGPEAEDHTLYSSHTVWQDRETFTAWTQSEQFRKAHARAGSNKPLHMGHPTFEGFESVMIQTLEDSRRTAAE